jgi:uncharacterized metal-binding protein
VLLKHPSRDLRAREASLRKENVEFIAHVASKGIEKRNLSDCKGEKVSQVSGRMEKKSVLLSQA